MDCAIAGPSSVKLFASSISFLSKIGKDLYVEHDVASGVVLRALNDSKSAYASVRFAPSFFERCSTGSSGISSRATTSTRSHGGGKRSRHYSVDHDAAPTTTQQHEASSQSQSQEDSSIRTNGTATDDGDIVSVRIPMRAMAPIVKPRKDVRQLRITTASLLDDESASLSSSAPARLQLAFEFLVVKRLGGNARGGGGGGGSDEGTASTVIRVVHCIPACDADAVSAVVDTATLPSELQCPPRALLRLLEPVSKFKDVTEVALLVHKNSSVLTAQSFHHTDKYRTVSVDVVPPPQQLQQQESSSSTNRGTSTVPVLQWVQRERRDGASSSSSSRGVVKTEASMPMEEIEVFNFQDDRCVGRGDNDDDDDDDVLSDLPDHVNDGVVLVFPVKEAKAFLQFGSSIASSSASLTSNSSVMSSSSSSNWQHHHHHLHLDSTRVQFHWGGKPVVMEMSSSTTSTGFGNHDGGGHARGLFMSGPGSTNSPFTARLVLASLDHKLLVEDDDAAASTGDRERTMN